MSDFKAIMYQNQFRLGLCPRGQWGVYSAPPHPLAGFKGPTSRKREGRGEQRREGAIFSPNISVKSAPLSVCLFFCPSRGCGLGKWLNCETVNLCNTLNCRWYEVLGLEADQSVEYGTRQCQDLSRVVHRLINDGKTSLYFEFTRVDLSSLRTCPWLRPGVPYRYTYIRGNVPRKDPHASQ